MAEVIRVLHVDDEPEFADLTADFLKREDNRFDVVTETHPRDALRRLSDGAIDCVVSDYEMPELDGLSFLAEIRERDPEIPFILFTGKGSEEIASDAISAGVTDYLQKERGTSQYEVLANRIVNAVEKHHAELSLRHREERLEALLTHSSDVITIVNVDGEITYCSPSVERHFGYEPGQLNDGHFGDFLHPEDQERLDETVRTVNAESESMQSMEFRFRHEDGSWRWVESVMNNQLADSLVGGIVLNWRDITEQKNYEWELQETNELLKAVIEASPVAILSYDLDGTVQLWNPAAEENYGWSAEEILGERLPTVPEEKEDEKEEIYERVFAGESITNLELRRETKSGKTIDISLSTAPLQDKEGEVIGNVSVAQDITERKTREQELRAIRRRMNLALSGTDSIIWERDVQSDTFTRHGPVEHVYGGTDKGVGETMDEFYEMVHPADRLSVREAMETAVETGGEYDVEYRIEEDGDIRWFRTQASVEMNDEGETVQVVGLATDITELKRRERELQRYETIVEALGDPVYAIDTEGHYTYVNDAYVNQTGYPREELLDAHVSEVVSEEDLNRAREHIRQLLKDDDRRSITWEGEQLTTDGDRIPFEHHVALLPLDENGDPQGTAGVIRDISDRKEREERLKEMTDRMQLALEGSNSWVWDWNLETDMTTQSAVAGIFGVEEEIITRPVDEFLDQLHPEDREVFLTAKEQAITGNQGYHAEYRLTDDDEIRWIEARGQLYRDTPGESARIIGIATDVTEQKERAMERQWMQSALDQSSEAVLVSHPETASIEFVNDTACEQLGYDRDELLDKTILDVQLGHSTLEEWAAHVDRLRSERHYLFEGTQVRSDGTRFPVEVNAGFVEIDHQEYILGIARDITHRIEREHELQRQIDQLDEFASIVSHDLRSPLNVARGNLELVKEECESDRLDTIDRSVDRMQTLIEDLLTLAREGGPSVEIESVSIRDVSKACWETVETGEARLSIQSEAMIRADLARFRQLLENLFRNAVEHGGENVTITIGETTDRRGFFVEDDGPGIHERDRPHVFETGYSTNEKGTGFGLAIVKKIAEAHGWTISVTDSEGGGARFQFASVSVDDG